MTAIVEEACQNLPLGVEEEVSIIDPVTRDLRISYVQDC